MNLASAAKAVLRHAWLIFFMALGSGRAFSFPENTRHGYPSCVSCHVSPAGGGALTAYGRGASEAFMSSWAFEGEGQPDWGFLGGLPSWLALGGDQRGVAIASRDEAGAFGNPKGIPMELSAEAAIIAGPITLDVSGGVYGPDRTLEYRRFFAKLMLTPTIEMRAGRFIPAYGINVEDHTTATRTALSLGQGSESYNAEAAWLAPGGELIATAILGQTLRSEMDNDSRIGTLRTDDMVGGAVRAAAYTDSRSSIGASALSLKSFAGAKRDAVGAFTQAGLSDKVFVLAEADKLWERGQPAATVSMTKVGAEIVAGLMATVQADTLGAAYGGRLGLQWMPRPHWELLGELRATPLEAFDGLPKNSIVGLLHHWL